MRFVNADIAKCAQKKNSCNFAIRTLRALCKRRYSTHTFIQVTIVIRAQRIAFVSFRVNNVQIRRLAVELMSRNGLGVQEVVHAYGLDSRKR